MVTLPELKFCCYNTASNLRHFSMINSGSRGDGFSGSRGRVFDPCGAEWDHRDRIEKIVWPAIAKSGWMYGALQSAHDWRAAGKSLLEGGFSCVAEIIEMTTTWIRNVWFFRCNHEWPADAYDDPVNFSGLV